MAVSSIFRLLKRWFYAIIGLTDRGTVLVSSSHFLFAKDNTMTNDFHYNTQNALIQGMSVQAGKLFADLYSNGTQQQSEDALEAYKSLRRLLPREFGFGSSRHIGSMAAHKATQGA